MCRPTFVITKSLSCLRERCIRGGWTMALAAQERAACPRLKRAWRQIRGDKLRPVIERRCFVAGAILVGGCFTDASANSNTSGADETGTSASAGGEASSEGSASVTSSDSSTASSPMTTSTTSADSSSGSETSGGASLGFEHELTVTLPEDLSDPVVGLPLLLRLRPSTIDYDATGRGGNDLRFFSANGVDPLDFEIEWWSPGGESVVWIRYDAAEPSEPGDTLIMRYGDPALAEVPFDPTRVWERYESVWHLTPPMDERLRDSASAPAHAAKNGDEMPLFGDARIGPGLRNTDGGTFFRANAEKLVVGSSFTVMAWINVRDNTQLTEPPTNRAPVAAVSPFAWELIAANFSNQRGGLGVETGAAGGVSGAATIVPLPVTQWVHLVGLFDGGRVEVYLDGILEGQGQADGVAVSDASGVVDIGGRAFDGDLDEVRISAAPLTDERIRLEWASMEGDGLISVGPKEPHIPGG